MMTLMEDVRSLVRQMGRTFGLSGTAARVVSVVVLGIVLNVIALGVVHSVRADARTRCEQTALSSVAETEFKVVRAVVVTTLKKIGAGQKSWCMAQEWARDRQAEIAKYRSAISFSGATHADCTGGVQSNSDGGAVYDWRMRYAGTVSVA
jgi:hypothetical protein